MFGSFVQKSLLVSSIAAGCLAIPFAATAGSGIVSTGTFEGRSDHIMSGGVTVLKTETKTLVVLESDFFLDGAPDPKLGFGNNGYDAATQFSVLNENTGAQVYVLPDSVDPGSYNELWVWCEKFNVPLGVAPLQ